MISVSWGFLMKERKTNGDTPCNLLPVMHGLPSITIRDSISMLLSLVFTKITHNGLYRKQIDGRAWICTRVHIQMLQHTCALLVLND